MYKLVVLADDFTGALDTGVQFTKKGISTLVTTNSDWDFTVNTKGTQVLVIDMESRHLKPHEAYTKLYHITKECIKNGIEYIYKKTDSGLRGNIGSELAALVDAFEKENIFFVPAFPKTQRVTIKGIHYIGGKRVTETEFGRDPFEPVRFDHVQEIIKDQSDVTTITVEVGKMGDHDLLDNEGKIFIFDTEKEEDLQNISKSLKNSGTLRLLAGCAGFADYLPEIVNLQPDRDQDFYLESKTLVVSGSINDITLRQIEYALNRGYDVVRLSPEEKLSNRIESIPTVYDTLKHIKDLYLENGKVIVDGGGDRELVAATGDYARSVGLADEKTREVIANNIGKFVKKLSEEDIQGTYIIFGGDTLKAVIDHMGFDILEPVAEIESGIVLSKVSGLEKNFHIISKSGGFGGVDVLMKIEEYIKKNSNNNKEAHLPQ